MKYYKCIEEYPIEKEYITLNKYYKASDKGNNTEEWNTIERFNNGTTGRYLQEVSKHEYILHKVKEIKAKILDKNNGFYVLNKDLLLFDNILNSMNCNSNIAGGLNYNLYIEQLSDNCWTHRGFISDTFIKQYNLNLINFKDLIDEIKKINNEI